MSEPSSAQPKLRFLAISGSLRGVSSSTTLLQAAAELAADSATIAMYPTVAALPHFNPDLDAEGAEPPPPVADFRARLRQADAVLICSPEYAHGVPGALKNALDWVVGSGELMHKPVAIINASATSTHAQASLAETLRTMMADVVEARIPLKSNKVGYVAILADPAVIQKLLRVVESLATIALTRP